MVEKNICVECGKESSILIDGVCPLCYSKKTGFIKIGNRIEVTICPICGAIKDKSIWRKEALDIGIKRNIIHSIDIDKILSNRSISIYCKKKSDDLYMCKVEVEGHVEDYKIIEKRYVEVTIKKQICQECSRKAGRYFESIIQIRAKKREPTDEEITRVLKEAKEHISYFQENGKAVFITEIKSTRGGIDIYVSNKDTAYTIAHKLHKSLGGEMKRTAKESGMNKGRKIYRTTYLIRLPMYSAGDIIISKDKNVFYVKTANGNRFRLLDLSSWEKLTVDYKDLKDFLIAGNEGKIKEGIVVSQDDRELQIMDLSTYKIKYVLKPSRKKFGSSIRFIKIKDRIYLIP